MVPLAVTYPAKDVSGLTLQAKALRELARRIELHMADTSGADIDVSAWVIRVVANLPAQ